MEEAYVDELQDYGQRVADFVGACCNVNYLYLSGTSVSAICCSSSPMPIFHNLRILELGYLNRLGWELLPHLLERAPLPVRRGCSRR